MIIQIFILLACAHKAHAQFSNVGAEACSQIIKAGVYNTLKTSSAQLSYSAFQSTMCSDLSGYSFMQYTQDSSSKQANSKSLQINAAASYFGIGASAGVGMSSSNLSENQFSQFKAAQSAYKQTGCASTSSQSDFSNSPDFLSLV